MSKWNDPEFRKAYQKEWHQRNKEARNEQNKEWRRNNPDKVADMYRRYASKQEERWEFFRKLGVKYNMTEDEYNALLSKQKGICPILQTPLDRPCVDHDHQTGEVRGLLSNNANTALGMLQENPEAFYRLAAYLTLDCNKKLVYIIGSLRNESVQDVANTFRGRGYDAFDNWFSAGREADDYWRDYEKQKGISFSEALRGRSAEHVFRFDKAYLDLCDAVVLVMPAGKSGHLELGYAIGKGKPGYILLDEEPERFDVMPQFADVVTTDIEEIFTALDVKTEDEIYDTLRELDPKN